jgi:uncharacterized Tic20 family protein/DNA-directed RNA polymerase subunit RPC12/RpoP
MIRYQCPKCGNTLEVPDGQAGQTVACTHCGNHNVVPPPAEPAGAAPTLGPVAMSAKDARMWAMFCHLGGLAGYVVPFGHIIAPLVVWLVQREKSSFVEQHGKEALNFQISWTIWAFVGGLLIFAFCIGYFILAALAIADVILVILAAIRANEGGFYRYPLTIRFIS